MEPLHLFSDKHFLDLYPASFRVANRMHYTPIEVVKKAAAYLCQEKNTTILDIGSGIGKFCIPAASLFPENNFVGIELRADLSEEAHKIRGHLGLSNLTCVQGDIVNFDLQSYDHFYFFNAFYEFLENSEKLDQQLEFTPGKFQKYHAYIFRSLEKMPIGTKLATFFTEDKWIPSSYVEVEQHFDATLKHWMKIQE